MILILRNLVNGGMIVNQSCKEDFKKILDMKDRMSYKKYWIDKKGNKHLIGKMDSKHLVNVIQMLERQATNMAFSLPYPHFRGEMAQDCAEREHDNMQDDPVDYFLSDTVYDFLVEEACKRNLNMPNYEGE